MPFKVRFIRENDLKSQKKENKIIIYFIKVFNLKFNINKFIEKFFKDNDSLLTEIVEGSKAFFKYKSVLKSFAKTTIIDKLTIISKVNNVNSGFLAYNSIYYLRSKINQYFIDLDNEFYTVQLTDKNDLDFEVVFHTRIIYLIYSYLVNIKNLIKFKKKKGSVL